MIRPERFAVSRETFASERKAILADAANDLFPHISDALARLGLPSWERPAVAAALELFDLTARAEVDEWSQVIDDMREMFAEELGAALAKTKPSKNPGAQANTITNWIAQMAHNAAIEAATTADPDGNVGLEWVSMEDSAVRSPHKDANGQVVPTGHEFEVGGEKMLYPGQPVGDPANWINCRCLAAPAMLTSELSGKTGTFASTAPGLKKDGTAPTCKYCSEPATQYVLHSEGMAYVPACAAHIAQAEKDAADGDPGNVDRIGQYSLTAAAGEGNASDPGVAPGETPNAAVVVLRPRMEDPIMGIASGVHPHCTLLYLGDATVDLEPLKAVVEALAKSLGHPMTDKVSGRAVLGPEKADVLLLDASGSSEVRQALLNEPAVMELNAMQEQFPAWIPHLTIGYPENPAEEGEMPADITYDLLSIWRGNETYDYPLEAPVADKPTHPEDPEFTQALADAFVAAVPETPVVAEDAPTDPVPEAEALRPWHGVLAPEGAPSGDKRGFAARMLTSRDLPLPLKAQFVDDEGHKGSVIVGRIDEVYRDGGLIKAAGVWDISPEADKAWGMIDRKMWRGVSVDLDAVEGELVEASEEGKAPTAEYTEGRVCSSTLCAIPAFAEAFIRNGTWEEFANEPMPSGAMVEIPDWEAAEKSPALSLVASGAPSISADFFRNPMLEEPTAMSLGEDGHIFGHLAAWEACHIGFEVCTTAPASTTDYAYFLTGQVFTDAGPVAVGQITLGGGHADGKLGVRATMAHYDNVATAVADITVGEDEFGIWFSGRLRDWTTPKQVHELFAAGPSGDWRGVRFRGMESLELVAAHAVNVQGFPIPRARFAMEGTRQLSLTAAGALAMSPSMEAAAIFADLRRMEFEHINTQFTALKGQ